MGKASWKCLTLGILATLLVSCSESDDTRTELSPDAVYQTVFRCTGQLVTECDGTVPLTEYSMVRIFVDDNSNGPDDEDMWILPFDYALNSSGLRASFSDFFIDESHNVSPVFENVVPFVDHLRLYLQLYTGDAGRTIWTSPVFYIYPHAGTPDTLTISSWQWTCSISGWDAPTCYSVPSNIVIDSSESVPADIEVRTCTGAWTSIKYRALDRSRWRDFPPMRILPSRGEAPTAEIDYNPAQWFGMNTPGGGYWWLRNLEGGSYGNFVISWLDSIPIARVDSMSLTQQDSVMRLDWHTTFEANCARIELWSNHVPYLSQPWTLVAVIQAQRSPLGANYTYIDTSYNGDLVDGYTLVAVGDNGEKFALKLVGNPFN